MNEDDYLSIEFSCFVNEEVISIFTVENTEFGFCEAARLMKLFLGEQDNSYIKLRKIKY